ncbi:hypothetical protein D3OALGB2SA_260 [Olavius algarvensis associated proteobacterium Delta 3]|nr:hypothetical protein D3OALGB2SA_260 [Olavius algarvensis associated proteobacterium Delta 3]
MFEGYPVPHPKNYTNRLLCKSLSTLEKNRASSAQLKTVFSLIIDIIINGLD